MLQEYSLMENHLVWVLRARSARRARGHLVRDPRGSASAVAADLRGESVLLHAEDGLTDQDWLAGVTDGGRDEDFVERVGKWSITRIVVAKYQTCAGQSSADPR